VNDESLPMDDNGYGTHIAGTIVAEDYGSVDVHFGPKAPAGQGKQLDLDGGW
jgi:subtilisin family serine protease